MTEEDGIGDFHVSRLLLAEPLPTELRNTEPPQYLSLEREGMRGALLDFEASGFVGNQFCPECGTRRHDIHATNQRQRSGTWPMALVEGTWNGAHLFTTDLSTSALFCTDAVLDCAKRHRHTNFKFRPLETAASVTKGIEYL